MARASWRHSRLPVIAENLIRAENTAVTPIDEIIKFQDESRFHRTVHALCLHVSNPYGSPGRDCLRHQIAVLQLSAPRRLRLKQSDRLLWILWSWLWPEWRRWLRILKPD